MKDAGKIESFKNHLFVDLGITDHPKRDLLFEKAWELGHSSGFDEVAYYAQELYDLICTKDKDDLIREMAEAIENLLVHNGVNLGICEECSIRNVCKTKCLECKYRALVALAKDIVMIGGR